MSRPLYIHVRQASHFLEWESEHWSTHFEIIHEPRTDALLLAFGPDVLFESAALPALRRFAVLFPGFGINPLHDLALRLRQREVIASEYEAVFINPGPLELAYEGIDKVSMFPISVNGVAVPFRPRLGLASLLHASADYPQKDHRRNLATMEASGLDFEVFPPRRPSVWRHGSLGYRIQGRVRGLIASALGGAASDTESAQGGYVSHEAMFDKYLAHDGFVHVARDIGHPLYLDGKYTATLIEAGISGAVVFWHDTFGLGNTLETVYSVPLDPVAAAAAIREVSAEIDIKAHSRATHVELLAASDPRTSVEARAMRMFG